MGFSNLKVSQGGARAGPGRRRGAGSEEAVPQGGQGTAAGVSCVRDWLGQLTSLMSSVQPVAVRNRINTQYWWLLLFYGCQAAKAG